jgi:hypothetical protein
MPTRAPSHLFLFFAVALAILGLTGCGGARVSVAPQTVTIAQPATKPRPAHVQTYTLFATQSVVEPRFSLEKMLGRTLRNFQVFPLEQQQRIVAALEAEGLRPDPNNQGHLQVFASLSFVDLWGADQSSWSTHLNGGVSGSATVKIVDATASMQGVTIALGFGEMPSSYVFGSPGGGVSDNGWRPTPAAARVYPTVAAAKQAWTEDMERLAMAIAKPAVTTAVTKALDGLDAAWRGARTPVDLPFVRVDSSDPRWTSANQQVVTSCYRQRTAPNPPAIPQDLADMDRVYADLAARPQPGEHQAQDVAAATWNRGVLAAWAGDETAALRFADEARRADPDQGVYRQMADVIARLGKARRTEQRVSTGE